MRGNRQVPSHYYLDRQRLQVNRLLLEDPSRLLTLLLVVVEPGPCRDKLADDHVLLQTTEPADLARDCGLGQHAGCLLEGRGREPRRRVQSRLDQAQQHGLRGGRFPALRQRPRVALLVLPLRDDLAREQAGVARGVDADLPHHLPDDDLDVLVVDVDTLRAVDLLDLVDQERLHRLLAQDVEQLLRRDGSLRDLLPGLDQNLLTVTPVQLGPDADLMRDRVLAHILVEGPHRDLLGRDMHLASVAGAHRVALGIVGQLLALHHVVAVLHERLHLGVERIGDLELLLGDHAHLARALLADDLELPVDLGDDGLALGDASLEQLLHAGQALGDVHAGDAARVERTHRELGARLADGLRCDDAHRLADLNDLAGGQVPAVAGAADALARLSHEHRPHLDRDAGLDDLACVFVSDRGACRHQDLAVDGDVLSRHPPGDLLVYGLVACALGADLANPDAVGGSAVLFTHYHVLRDVDEPARQVAGVGGPESSVGQTLARAVRGDEVLEHGQALCEVGLDRKADDPAGGVGQEATHPRQLADLLAGCAGTL